MENRETILDGLREIAEQETSDGIVDGVSQELIRGALEMLKEQEPRLITKDDFANADAYGTIPAWIEYHPKFRDVEPVWGIIDIDKLSSPFSKAWTAKPTEEQRKAVKWDD